MHTCAQTPLSSPYEITSPKLGQKGHNHLESYLSHTYHLAQAHVDASALPNSIAHLTVILHPPFHSPRHVVRITHEQNLIFTIEEGRTDTQEDYRVLEERVNMIEEQRKNTSLKNWAFVLLEPGGDRAMYTVGNEDLWLAKVLQQ